MTLRSRCRRCPACAPAAAQSVFVLLDDVAPRERARRTPAVLGSADAGHVADLRLLDRKRRRLPHLPADQLSRSSARPAPARTAPATPWRRVGDDEADAPRAADALEHACRARRATVGRSRTLAPVSDGTSSAVGQRLRGVGRHDRVSAAPLEAGRRDAGSAADLDRRPAAARVAARRTCPGAGDAGRGLARKRLIRRTSPC